MGLIKDTLRSEQEPKSSSPRVTLQVMKVGVWRDSRVCLRRVPADICFTGRPAKMAAITLKTSISHHNLLKFHGITQMDSISYIVSDFPEKGALVDILQSTKYNLGENWKFSIALDIACGMDYLHKRGLVHGGLTSDACVLDGRWSAKVMDWEYHRLQTACCDPRFEHVVFVRTFVPECLLGPSESRKVFV